MSSNKRVTPCFFSKTSLLILLFLLPVLGFYLGIKYYKSTLLQQTTSQQSDLKTTQDELNRKCAFYGFSQKEDFLLQYAVKRGDTLLSIAKIQLGNVSRVNELIELNKDKYVELSLKNPFVEQGWVLFLPPKYVTSSNGKIMEYNGEISEINGNGRWVISNPNSTVDLSPNKNTKYLEKTSFQVGDCVKVVYQAGAYPNLVVFSVSPQ